MGLRRSDHEVPGLEACLTVTEIHLVVPSSGGAAKIFFRSHHEPQADAAVRPPLPTGLERMELAEPPTSTPTTVVGGPETLKINYELSSSVR